MKEPYKKKDEQLFAEVQRLKEGDFSSSNAVYELSEKYIYKIINDIVKNHHTTEDLMQEAYIQIYNKIETLQEAKAFYVWAGRIATNLTLRYIQKNSKEVLATPDEEGDTDFIFEKATDDKEKFIPESVLVDREKQRLLADIIDKLSAEQKFCVQYFYYEEMSVNEIAEVMGCSAGTVKSRLNYARKSIKDAVIELDVKHGTRLYSLASAPLFLIIFRATAEGLLPAAIAGASATEVSGIGSASEIGTVKVVGSASQTGSVIEIDKPLSQRGENTRKVFPTGTIIIRYFGVFLILFIAICVIFIKPKIESNKNDNSESEVVVSQDEIIEVLETSEVMTEEIIETNDETIEEDGDVVQTLIPLMQVPPLATEGAYVVVEYMDNSSQTFSAEQQYNSDPNMILNYGAPVILQHYDAEGNIVGTMTFVYDESGHILPEQSQYSSQIN